MATRRSAFPAGAASAAGTTTFAAMSARRLLVIGGIVLILVGMLLGDIFAVFVLHQNAARIGRNLLAATQAVAAQDAAGVSNGFQRIGGSLENRGTKVDAHVHMIDFGYLALLFALVQPYVALSERRRKLLAELLIFGAAFLPVGVFLIHYVGLAYSPFPAIGWASVLADFGGLLVLVAVGGELWGIWRYLREAPGHGVADELLADRSWAGRALLAGGALLVLAGFVHGAYYAAAGLYQHEAKDAALISAMVENAATNRSADAAQAVAEYGQLQGDKAVNVAAHAHIVEFGMLAMMLAFFQPYVLLSERWKRAWVKVLLLGSVLLPVCVLMEVRWGLVSGGIADFGGLLVIVALLGMLAGIVRYTGKLGAAGVAR